MRFVCTIAALLLVFSVPIGAQTLLNGHFATPYVQYDSNTRVAQSWSHFKASQNPEFKQSTFEEMPGGPGGQVSCQQIWSDWTTYDAGIYQRVTGVTVGQTYRATGWCLSIWGHGLSLSPPYQDGSIYQKVGIDPYGGTDPSSANIVWSWNDPLDRRWRELVADCVAQSTAVTVFARTNCTTAQTNCLSFFDAFALSAATPVVISNLLARPGSTDATFTWTTDVPSDSAVDVWQYRGTVKNATTYTNSALVTQHSIIATGLTSNTQYYFRVRSHATGRNDGVSCGGGAVSNPIKTMFGTPCATLAQAKNNPDGAQVFLRNVIVSAGTSHFTNAFFVQEQDRSNGIKVDKGFLTVPYGRIIDISGTLASTGGERRITGASVFTVSTPGPPKPLALACSAVGGEGLNGYTPGITGGVGPHNLGLLVRAWGRITAVDSSTGNKFFYIDDGSGLEDGTVAGRKGLRVTWLNLWSAPSPQVGKYALVTGIASCFQSGGHTRPQILLRGNTTADFQQF